MILMNVVKHVASNLQPHTHKPLPPLTCLCRTVASHSACWEGKSLQRAVGILHRRYRVVFRSGLCPGSHGLWVFIPARCRGHCWWWGRGHAPRPPPGGTYGNVSQWEGQSCKPLPPGTSSTISQMCSVKIFVNLRTRMVKKHEMRASCLPKHGDWPTKRMQAHANAEKQTSKAQIRSARGQGLCEPRQKMRSEP